MFNTDFQSDFIHRRTGLKSRVVTFVLYTDEICSPFIDYYYYYYGKQLMIDVINVLMYDYFNSKSMHLQN